MPRFLLVYCTIPLMLALWFLSAVATAAETIHETDFGTATVPVNHSLEGTRKGSFVGVLPPSWSEDFTAWSTSVATAKLASEGERAHLQLSIESGFSQFHTGLPDLVEGAHYRLSLQARNQASGPLTVGLRMRPAPYHFVWSCQVQSADRWVDRSWCFALSQKPSQRLGIFLVAGGVGQVDVRGVRLERLTDAEVAALIQRPSPTLRNLFRNSRFPLGLQSGWNLNRACDSEMASADPERIGPSGAPALRLAAATRCILYSEPFCVADATRKNRVALSFTGTGTWHMAMLQGGREIATKNLTPKAEWQREGLDFSPDPAARAFALRISGTGTLWIDGLSAHAGTENRPYESAVYSINSSGFDKRCRRVYFTKWLYNQKVTRMTPDRLDATFAALADPTRRAILARLRSGEVSVTELAAPFKMSLPAVSKHLKVLERAGLIVRGRDAQWRPCRLEASPLKEAADWIDDYRRFWDERYDRLEEYLRDVQSGENR